MKSLKCAAFTDALIPVEVESTFVRGLPGFNIVGLAGATIKESESRVKAALMSLNFKFPASKIIINLSPSDMPKNGSHFDLAIALLIALQKERIDGDFFVFGELGLDGSLKSTASLFSCTREEDLRQIPFIWVIWSLLNSPDGYRRFSMFPWSLN